MDYTRPNRHYRKAGRMARRNAEKKESRTLKGTFIPEEEKKKIFAMAGGVAVLSFALGFLIGCVIGIDE
jgi:hypothetical protein